MACPFAKKSPRNGPEDKHTCAIPIDFELVLVLKSRIFETIGIVSILVLKEQLYEFWFWYWIRKIACKVSISLSFSTSVVFSFDIGIGFEIMHLKRLISFRNNDLVSMDSKPTTIYIPLLHSYSWKNCLWFSGQPTVFILTSIILKSAHPVFGPLWMTRGHGKLRLSWWNSVRIDKND